MVLHDTPLARRLLDEAGIPYNVDAIAGRWLLLDVAGLIPNPAEVAQVLRALIAVGHEAVTPWEISLALLDNRAARELGSATEGHPTDPPAAG